MRLVQSLVCLIPCLTTLCLCADQDLLTILKQQANVGLFTTYIEAFPDLVDQLNNDTFTVLAPNDDAINAFVLNNTDINTDQDKIRALLEYHVSHLTHPSATFGIAPIFPATLLTNPLYANVTGGQRVELIIENDKPAILSGLKKPSRILTPDIFFQGGLIHIIDSVLTIPVSFPATISASGLDDLVALLNLGGWLNPNGIAIQIANSVPDLTIWGPNDPRFGATFTGFDTLSEKDLDSIFTYSAIQGTAVYSDMFKNNSKFKTMQGESIIMTEANGGFYVDQARIKTRDYLCANGVMQIIDQPLNPNNTGTRPVILPPEPENGGTKGLSSAAAAGIGIAIGVLLLGGGIVAALIIKNRKKRRGQLRINDGGPQGRGPLGGSRVRQATHDTIELEYSGAPPRYELDNKNSNNATTFVELQTPAPQLGPDDAGKYVTTTTIEGERSRGQSMNNVRSSMASAGGFSLNLRGPAGSGLPPSPPNTARGRPQEIDGQERGRISIHFSGETPRHVGFQARY